MGSRRRRLPAVWFLFPFLMAFQLCASLNQEGAAVLRIKEANDADTYGALLDWDDGDVNPCSWFGAECSDDGRVMGLNMRSAATRKLLESIKKGSQKNKMDGPGTPTFAHSISNPGEMTMTAPPTPFLKPPLRSDSHHRESRHLPSPLPAPSPGPIQLPPVSPVIQQGASQEEKGSSSSTIYALIGAVISFVVVALLAACFFYYCHRNSSTVVPLPATSSTQLQTTAIGGITLFRLSQLEKACEGFSNIIGTVSGCTLYKGNLPCGAEIAVVSPSAAYAGGWSPAAEAHFKNKVETLSMVNHKNLMNLVGYCEDEEPFTRMMVETLSMVNHKNLMNLVGYCEDEEPFTRMMVFEYVSNGSLFEHLHVKESEHLNWQSRLRIAMGVVYCLDYLHLQSPPVNLRNINSSCIYLTDDNATKVSDISFYNDKKEGEDELDASDEYSTVYKYALLLLETISGRRPYSDDDGLLVLWAQRYLTGAHPVMGMVDPTLNSVPEEQVKALSELIRSCISEDSRLRPTIVEVSNRMQDITAITQDQAIPRRSALWWAELEIIAL